MPVSHWLLLASLYMAQGIPGGLLAHALPALMREQGVSLTVIGGLKLLALPWVLKFLWAPWVDRYCHARSGAHRSWIIPMQLSAALMLLVIAGLGQAWLTTSGMVVFVVLLALLNLVTATQDIATDGLTVKLTSPSFRGLANSVQVAGYKTGMIGASSLFLLSAGWLGWSWSFLILALCMLLLLVPVLLFKELPVLVGRGDRENETAHSWHQSYRGFIVRPGVMHWLLVLLLYKVADAIGSGMTKPLLVDLGLGLEAIAAINAISSGVGLMAAFIGGWLYYRFNAYRSLILFGVLQALGMLGYGVLAYLELSSLFWIYLAVLFEQVADALSTVALFAVMMNCCRKGFEGSDYTLQACLQVMAGGVFGLLGGVLASHAGYTVTFVTASVIGVGVILWLALYPGGPLIKRGCIDDESKPAKKGDCLT